MTSKSNHKIGLMVADLQLYSAIYRKFSLLREIKPDNSSRLLFQQQFGNIFWLVHFVPLFFGKILSSKCISRKKEVCLVFMQGFWITKRH